MESSSTDDQRSSTDAGLILVVDDEPMIRDLAQLALTRRGYRVENAGSAAEAIARFGELAAEVDAVIVDKNLPGASGVELIAAFRAEVPDLPAILISGDIFSPSEDGRTVLIGKPFRLEDLTSAVGRAIAQRGG